MPRQHAAQRIEAPNTILHGRSDLKVREANMAKVEQEAAERKSPKNKKANKRADATSQ